MTIQNCNSSDDEEIKKYLVYGSDTSYLFVNEDEMYEWLAIQSINFLNNCQIYVYSEEIKKTLEFEKICNSKVFPSSKELNNLSKELHNLRENYWSLNRVTYNKEQLRPLIIEIVEKFNFKLVRFKELAKEFPYQDLDFNQIRYVNKID